MTSLIERWTAVGFTEYEAKAYVALLKLGPATGYQVAKESGVPRSTIYEVLAKLVARGAVLTQSFAELVRYAPVPPEQLLARLRRELEDTLEDLAQGLKGVASGSEMQGNAWNLTGRKNIFAYAGQMLDRAQSEVALITGDDDELDELLRRMQEAHGRGVKMLVISPVPYDAGELPVMVYPEGQSLRQATGHGFVLVIDGREALMGEVDRSVSAFWTTNTYVTAWVRWCLAHELAGQAARRGKARRS
jgi:predicted transcriptional regulator